ncbi:MAG: hypothetical protein GY742_19565 [Hyphomicrobiales bacterium]|nr:hypothetical protein [Hyphomicrobiales bacterium]
MKTLLFITVIGTAGLLFSIPASAGPNCTCRYKGKNVPEGQSTCIKTAKGYKIAKCSRVLNNTSWKFTKKECPVG